MAQEGIAMTANANHPTMDRFSGFTIREAAAIAAVATVRLRHAVVGGLILEQIELVANGSLSISYGTGNWKQSSGGVYVEVVGGTIEGTLFTEV